MSLAEKLDWSAYPIAIEWRYCGHLWELLLTPKHPERFDWGPRCPTCGEQHDDGWTRLELKLREEHAAAVGRQRTVSTRKAKNATKRA